MKQVSSVVSIRQGQQRVLLTLLTLCVLILTSCAPLPTKTYGVVTQISTYPAFQSGLYNGDVTYAQLARDGDFGVGTFDALDGEMIALDGKFYQARIDGSVHEVDPATKAPFADVHFFRSKQQVQLKETLANYDALKAYLTKQLPSANRPYAFKITGNFPYLKIRSVSKQSEPYPVLQDVVAKQTVFELKNITGTLVGYAMPAYLGSVTVAGYHFHFISADHQHGGHMLDASLDQATIDIDYLEGVTFVIPQDEEFQGANLTPPTK